MNMSTMALITCSGVHDGQNCTKSTCRKVYSLWIREVILLEVWKEGGKSGYKYRYIFKFGDRKLNDSYSTALLISMK